jgi:hypothetical protein
MNEQGRSAYSQLSPPNLPLTPMPNLPASALTSPTLSGSPDWVLPRDLIEKFLAGRLVFVPRELRDAVEEPYQGMRIEKKETIYLVWSAIRSTPRMAKSQWRRVHHKLIYRSGGITPKRALEWLIDNEFVGVPEERNGYCPGVYSKKYRITEKAFPVPVELYYKNALDGVLRKVADDPACEYARHCLDALEADTEGLVTKVQEIVSAYKGLEKERKNKKGGRKDRRTKPTTAEATLYTLGGPLLQLCHQRGRIIRGGKGRRLCSPMTRLKSEFRSEFSYGNEPMAMLDMQCAQPCLLANLAGDSKLIADCLSDAFYTGIMDSLGVDRKKAKKAYCTYAYGKHIGETPVALYMRSRYQRASAYMAAQKSVDYRLFSHGMQQAEAAIFVDGVYPRMQAEGLEGVTIHDAILCREKDKSAIEAIIAEELEKKGITAKIKTERTRE